MSDVYRLTRNAFKRKNGTIVLQEILVPQKRFREKEEIVIEDWALDDMLEDMVVDPHCSSGDLVTPMFHECMDLETGDTEIDLIELVPYKIQEACNDRL